MLSPRMKVVNIAKAMIKLQFKLPQTLISQGFTRRTVLHAPAFQQKGINRLMDIYQTWKQCYQKFTYAKTLLKRKIEVESSKRKSL